MKRSIEIALDCIHADRKKRPKIGDIVNWLNETVQVIKKMVRVIDTNVQFSLQEYIFLSNQVTTKHYTLECY